MSYKMQPEQIAYLASAKNEFDYEDMKAAAIALLNGLTIEEIDMVRDNLKDYQILSDELDDAFKKKVNDISDIDKALNIATDWFEEIEK